jgi:hypothetical protein
MQQLLDKYGVQIAVADEFIATDDGGFNGISGGETVLYPLSVIGEGCTVADYEPLQLPEKEPVPDAITMRQARLALLGAGLLDDIDNAIAALPEPHKSAAKIEWEYSSQVQRNNGFVDKLAPMLGMSKEQIDQLFIAGSKL